MRDASGQAFPRSGYGFVYRDGSCESEGGAEGMTLRDYFAAKAMQELFNNHFSTDGHYVTASRMAYRMADAMLAERAK